VKSVVSRTTWPPRGTATREVILDTAERLFAERGIHAVLNSGQPHLVRTVLRAGEERPALHDGRGCVMPRGSSAALAAATFAMGSPGKECQLTVSGTTLLARTKSRY
jgi:hypothetical protein